MEPGRLGSGNFMDNPPGNRSCMMEQVQNPHFPVLIPGRPMSLRSGEDDISEECRNLIRVLSYTIDSLCSECSNSELKLRYIRALISSLSTLNTLSPDRDHVLSAGEGLVDINGTHYVSIRSCDLERFSAK